MSKAQSIVGTSPGRNLHDFYPTPGMATEALLSVETFYAIRNGIIWEPACGDGAISKILERHGHTVKSTDLIDRGYGEAGLDFLVFPERDVVDHIITNPPYALGQEFVETALLSATGKVAMLLKLVFLEGEKRRLMFAKAPPARIHVFSKRLSLARNGEKMKAGGMIAFAWFVWERGYDGKPVVGWI